MQCLMRICPILQGRFQSSRFYEAQVFVRRWMIRDKEPSIRLLCRKQETANSAVSVSAIQELKRESAARGLLPAVH
jgi:hypothetical protein